MLHPSTVHLCISRKWTAEKWIFRAPLSQNVFRHTLHWTRFLPVAGLMNCVPKFTGTAPHCRLAGDWGFRNCPDDGIDEADMEFDSRGRPGPCEWPDFGLRDRDSRLKFRALWWLLASSRISFFGSLRSDDDDGALLLAMLAVLFIKLEKDDAMRLAASGLSEFCNEFGCGGRWNGRWWPAMAAIFIKPAAWFGRDDLSLPVDSDKRRRAAWAAATCCKWCRSNSGLSRVDGCAGGKPVKRRKSNGCIFCKWFRGLDEPINAEAIVVGEWLLLMLAALLQGDDDGLLKKLFRWLGGRPAASFWCIWFDSWSCECANDPRCMFIGWAASRGGDNRLLGDITICFWSDKKLVIDWFALWNSSSCW